MIIYMMDFIENLHLLSKRALSRRFRGFAKMARKSVRFIFMQNPFRWSFFNQKVTLKMFLVNKKCDASFLTRDDVEAFILCFSFFYFWPLAFKTSMLKTTFLKKVFSRDKLQIAHFLQKKKRKQITSPDYCIRENDLKKNIDIF